MSDRRGEFAWEFPLQDGGDVSRDGRGRLLGFDHFLFNLLDGKRRKLLAERYWHVFRLERIILAANIIKIFR